MKTTRMLWWVGLVLGLVACAPPEVTSPDDDVSPRYGQIEGSARVPGAASHEGIFVTLEGTAFQTLTSATGDFRFEHVPVGEYALMAQKQGYARARHTVTVLADERVSAAVTLEKPFGGVEGSVLLRGASAHEDVTVTLEGAGLTTRTTANGGFRLDAVALGSYILVASKAGYTTGRQSVSVKEGQMATVSLSLELAISRIQGQVSLQGGSSGEGITVSLEGTALSTRTDANGNFTLEAVPAGRHVLVAAKEGYVTGRQSVEVRAGQASTQYLTLARATSRIEGQVSLQGETAHEGITVTLEGTRLSTTTNAQGKFLLEPVPTGNHVLVASKTGYSTEQRSVVVGTEALVLSLSLPRAFGQVTGMIGLRSGSNYSGTLVTLEGTNLTATTGANATFSFPRVPVGTYPVRVEKQGYVTGRTTVSVTDGRAASISMTLEPAPSRVEGTILLQGAASHEGTWVCLALGSFLQCFGSTDAQGNFGFDPDTMVGSMDLVAIHDGYTTGSTPVNVVRGTTVTVNMTLTPRAALGTEAPSP